ncbi:hypothetical protein DFH09DRAFT_173204 [Mycena vulgaris]|nr:hypothetical protein DFH09DRAFT_173204 [Mycena vulgaris]
MATLAWASSIWGLHWGRSAICCTRDVQHLPPTFTPVPGKGLPIMVRDAYTRIWYYIEEKRTSAEIRALLVWGQPGIGKSFFTFYALAQALERRIPFALCNNDMDFLLFNGSGVEAIPYSSVRAAEGKLSRDLLVFFDSSNGVTPRHPFVGHGALVNAFIVHCASPVDRGWKLWAKEQDARIWPMELWGLNEVQQLSTLLNIDPSPGYYSPVQLFGLLGPTARECFQFPPIQKSGDVYRDFHWSPLSFGHPHRFTRAMTAGVLHAATAEYQVPEFHRFFFCHIDAQQTTPRVKPERRETSILEYCTYIIPTSFLRSIVFGHNSDLQFAHQLELRQIFRSIPSVCGSLYEVLSIQNLIHLKFFHYKIGDAGSIIRFAQVVVDSRKKPSEFVPPHLPGPDAWLWLPPTGLPTIGAVLICDNGRKITMIQAAISRQHPVEPEGIARVWQIFGAEGREWHFVFVVPSEEIGQKLAAI